MSYTAPERRERKIKSRWVLNVCCNNDKCDGARQLSIDKGGYRVNPALSERGHHVSSRYVTDEGIGGHHRVIAKDGISLGSSKF